MRLDRGLVEIADRDDRHQVGPIPVRVELRQPIVLEALEDLLLADRKPLGVARALEQHRQLLVEHARARAAAEAPLLDDDAALLVDLGRIERDVAAPSPRGSRTLCATHVRLVGRHLQHVDRLVEARVRVDVRAEPHADRLHEVDDVLLREVLRAVERHVLDEVREPALVVVLEHRAGVDDEPQLRALLGPFVRADVVAQAVRELARRDLRIDGNLLSERRGFWRRGALLRHRGQASDGNEPAIRNVVRTGQCHGIDY